MKGSPRRQSTFGFMGEVPRARPGIKVGVVGATGAVGRMLVQVLAERSFPVGELHLFASLESEGQSMDTAYGEIQVEALDAKKPPRLEIAFLAVEADTARFWGWRLARRGAVVIDKSSYFRDKEYAPLIVPEVNGGELERHRGIIANPNCTTITLVMALAPLHRAFELRHVVAVSFQSVSGQGREGVAALERELGDPGAGRSVFPHRIAYNVIPWIGGVHRDFSTEEAKMIRETRRILGLPRLPVRVTAVRVPTKFGHAIAVHADFHRSVNLRRAKALLREFPGLKVMDDPARGAYPTPLDAAGRDEVLVGRIRRDRWGSRSLALWLVTDNLRKGAATNAVQIAEALLRLKEARAAG